MGELMASEGIERPVEIEDNPDFGTPDELITTTVDCSDVADRKFASLAAHASQSDNIFFLGMGEELFAKVMGTENFVRVEDSTGSPTPEDDLFAGLRSGS
jgi:LmbE family N-acetylglucosaminyl deacetylase